jgi:hypothetical protein
MDGTMFPDRLLAQMKGKNTMMVRLTSKLIQCVVLIACLVLVLPLSVVLHEMEGHPMKVHACCSTADESSHAGRLPAKTCPVMALRAGLALISLKSSSKTSDDARAITVIEAAIQALKTSPHPVPPTSVHESGPDLAFLKILRI